jgi:DNA-binding NtrC family response regulator
MTEVHERRVLYDPLCDRILPAKEEPYRILVADDQPAIRDALKLLLRSEGMEVDADRSPRVVLESIALREYDTLLLDLNFTRDTTSGREGIELLQEIKNADPRLPIIVMTAWGTIDLAVTALHHGARDFIQKPWDDERLTTAVRTQAELYRALRHSQRLEAENKLIRSHSRPTFIAQSPAMRPIVEAISRVGSSDASVLITGEHGTGKEVVAHMLHVTSLRSDKPLITVNTGGLPEGIFESELFGHVKGAFTDATTDRVGRFEMAAGGTLFLDEIANVPLRQQAKLLRVLETGEMERVGSSRTHRLSVRVLSATNADLHEACANGSFRQDLMFRLNTVEIKLPPLRERKEDLPALCSHFLAKHAARYGKDIECISPPALQELMAYPWPGNVRELDHTIERAVIMSRGLIIENGDLGLSETQRSRMPDLSEMSLEEVEALLISKALARCKGNVSRAAQVVGISRGTFYRRMEKYGLYVPPQDGKDKPQDKAD